MRRQWACILAGGLLVTGVASRARAADSCKFAGEPPPTAEQRASLRHVVNELRRPGQIKEWAGLRKELDRLLAGPCFHGLKNIAALPEFGSSQALKEWWFEGGESWFFSVIPHSREDTAIALPPSARRTLNLGNEHGQALAPLLCPAEDESCGRETRGWVMRAEDKVREQRTGFREDPAASVTYCNKVDRPTPAARYAAWRDCIESERHKRFADQRLPLGPFRAPSDGWIVIRGRRGHYEFCDGVAAYDLASGSVYRAYRCSDLGIFPPRDEADAKARQAEAAKVHVETGRLSVDDLREAVLMAMLWPERQEALEGFTARPNMPVSPLPKGFKYTPPEPEPEGLGSGDTWLSWDWFRQGKIWSSGKMMAPGLLGIGHHYPTWLLEIAEAGLQPACPPAPLPPNILTRGSPLGGVSPIDAPQDALDATERDLVGALREAAARGCALGR